MKILKILFFVCFSISVSAQTPEEVVEQYMDAIGGRSALQKVKTIRAEISMEANGFTMEGKIAFSLPDKQYTEMNFQGDKMVTVINGEKGWRVNPMTGSMAPIPMTIEEIRAERNNMLAEKFLDKTSYTLEDLGTETVKGQEYRVLKVAFNDGGQPPQKRYFNTTTGLMDFSEVESPVVGTIFVSYENYKNVNGLMFPQVIMSYTGRNLESPSMTMTLKGLEVNTPVDEKLFNKPQ